MNAIPLNQIEDATERLYALLPAYFRLIAARNGWRLKALIEVLAGGITEIDRELDALYNAMFVETTPEGALDDLAALVASETLRPLPPDSGHSARAFIANTVRYRRGKGTARVLEALAADVGGFGAEAVEYFMRLSRTQNLIDVRPERPGTAFLIAGVTPSYTATRLDVLPRLVDVRSIARAAGRHHVPNVGVHILRPDVPDYPVPTDPSLTQGALARVPVMRPWPNGTSQYPGYFQLSAQPGRMLRLFNPNRRSEDTASRVSEADLPDRARRLPLHLETEELRNAQIEGRPPQLGRMAWFDPAGEPFAIFLRAVGATVFTRVKPEEILIANLKAFPTTLGARPNPTRTHTWFTGATPTAVANTGTSPIRCGFDPVTGRLIAATPPSGGTDIEEARIAYGTGIGREIGAGPQERNTADVPFDIVDTPGLINFVRIVDATTQTGAATDLVRTVKTLDLALSEWSASGANKRGLIVLTRCDLEGAATGQTTISVPVHPGSELHIVAAQWQANIAKPGLPFNIDRAGYIIRRDARFTIDAPVVVTAQSAPPPGGRAGWLVLDGVELTQGLTLGAEAVSRLWLRHATVRAPGAKAVAATAALTGTEVDIERSMIGRIDLTQLTGTLSVIDSIASADGDVSGIALSASACDTRLNNVTVFGASSFKSLQATNIVFAGNDKSNGAATVTKTQDGCVRYSAIAPGSTMPRKFRCQPGLALAVAAQRKGSALTASEASSVVLGVTPLFLDTEFDEPTVAMLHPLTSDAIRLGGEGDSEMGVFSAAAEGLRMSNVTSLFDDYLPVGLEAAILDDTRSSAVATKRNRP